MIRKLATIADLMEVDGKAELVDGEIQIMSPAGDEPGYASGRVFISLDGYARSKMMGVAYADGKGFLTNLPNRQSFCPDAAFYSGPRAGMSFLPVPPVFAVEVRSENDYGPKAERAMARKRDDYFASGTLVVWDIDLQSEEVVRVYRASSPETPTVYKRGELAEAEPAVPGWHMPVDDLFRDE